MATSCHLKAAIPLILLSSFPEPLVYATGNFNNGPFAFEPIAQSAAAGQYDSSAPWIIPAGFSQYVVSDESDLNIYDGGRDDWQDMNTVNETGFQAGRYMYRTHEVRGQAEGGSVSVVDLKTGETRILAQDPSWDALDGIEWTPWGTILFAEETTGGRLFEIILAKNDPMTAAAVIDRPAVGRLAHEGIQVGPDGSVYVVDEFRGELEGYGGGIYKFVPERRGGSANRRLFALKVVNGQGEWVGPIDASDARQSGTDAGGTGWNRPEDIEIIGDTLYVAVTEGPRNGGSSQLYDGEVLALNLNSLVVSSFVKPGVNVPVEIGIPGASGFQTGFDNPDNLAQTPDGKLVIVEDNVPVRHLDRFGRQQWGWRRR
ncbi:MAG: DUF839 domain-containing protein [Chloroflexi bacterium]|nr:DUF839 domain-containing protein [Chloroflexota bacterium]